MSKKLKFLLALGGLVCCYACDKETAPSPVAVVASPSPSPTPDPSTSAQSCVQKNLKLEVLNAAGNPDVLFDYRELVSAVAQPVNNVGARLPDTCDFPRVVGWTVTGPLKPVGDLNGFAIAFRAFDPGDFSILATHNGFKAVWAGVLIRSKSGTLVLTESHFRMEVLR